jgi:hypothetical protein
MVILKKIFGIFPESEAFKCLKSRNMIGMYFFHRIAEIVNVSDGLKTPRELPLDHRGAKHL